MTWEPGVVRRTAATASSRRCARSVWHSGRSRFADHEVLTIVNDHEPKPLFYESQAEVSAFDVDGYTVEEDEPGKVVALFPKQ